MLRKTTIQAKFKSIVNFKIARGFITYLLSLSHEGQNVIDPTSYGESQSGLCRLVCS